MKVNTNSAGIAVSGEVCLYGMWDDGNGLFFEITQPSFGSQAFLYRSITALKDYKGGSNQLLSCILFKNKDYDGLINAFLLLKQQGADKRAA